MSVRGGWRRAKRRHVRQPPATQLRIEFFCDFGFLPYLNEFDFCPKILFAFACDYQDVLISCDRVLQCSPGHGKFKDMHEPLIYYNRVSRCLEISICRTPST